MKYMLKVVTIGPESTGKSSLCEALARHYRTGWCPEYARDYLLQHGRNYRYEDLLEIAQGQLALEERISADQHEHPLLLIDTDMYVMKVWCEFVFDNCHPWILDQIAERHYDLYLLCYPDLPWTPDDLREYPDHPTRERLFHFYRDLLIHQQVPWVDVRGPIPGRELAARAAIDRLLITQ